MSRPVKLLVIGVVLLLGAIPVSIVAVPLMIGLLFVSKAQHETMAACGNASLAAGSTTTAGLPNIGDISGAGRERYFQAVFAVAKGNNRLILAHLMGSHLESGWRNAIAGGAFGYYQIQDPGVLHQDISVTQALDPVYATRYMAGAYRDALNNVDPRLWSANPERAGETVAFHAEKPRVSYYTNRTAAVPVAFQAALAVMRAHGISISFGSSPGGTTSAASGGSVANLDTASIGCGVATVYGASIASSGAAKGVLAEAEKYLGVPYVWGGKSPSGFDCSGLVAWSFASVGINLQGNAATQWATTKQFRVSLSQAKPGDLLFFITDGSAAKPGHVGIYVGNGVMINAPHTGATVRYETITDAYWKAEFLGATDPFAWNQSRSPSGGN